MEHDFARIVESLHDGLFFVDADRRITFWNKAAEHITGFHADEVVGRGCSENILVHMDSAGRSLCEGMCPLAATIADGEHREADVLIHHKDGHRIPVSVRISPLLDDEGRIVGGIELFSDASSQESMRRKVAELEKLALIDSLTQLPNRRYLDSEIASQFSLLNRRGLPFGALFFDIDHFKHFNDKYGHHIGDIALQKVAKTLTASVRPFDTIGRWGGEEFLGIFPISEAYQLTRVADRLLGMVRNSCIETGNGTLRMTVSIGGTVAVKSDTVESLIKRADSMMYRSKRSGRDRVTTDISGIAETG